MTVVNSGVNASAQLYSYFDTTPTYGTPEKSGVDVRLDVDDSQVRKQFDYDGFERPFALVPTEVDGKVEWKREALQYQGSHLGGYIDLHSIDSYELNARDVNRDLVARYGIALGMDTNHGTVWLQQPGQNVIPQKEIY